MQWVTLLVLLHSPAYAVDSADTSKFQVDTSTPASDSSSPYADTSYKGPSFVASDLAKDTGGPPSCGKGQNALALLGLAGFALLLTKRAR